MITTRKIIPGTVVLLVILLYFFLDAREGGYPRCPFFVLTGLLCPGCGSQRALSSLLHGDFAEAISFNILLVLFMPLFFIAALNYIFSFSGKRFSSQKMFYSNRLIFSVLGIVILFWILRNLSGFEWLHGSLH